MSEFSADDFEPYVGKAFKVRDGRHELILSKVERFDLTGLAAEKNLRAPFNLIFKGPRDDLLAEGYYIFDIGPETSVPLYTIPIQTFEAGQQDYQAVFT